MEAGDFPVANSAAIAPMVTALKRAIAQTHPDLQPEVYAIAHLSNAPVPDSEVLVCPLTLNLPENFEFRDRHLYEACRDVEGLRELVRGQWQANTGRGNLWLPIALTAKGPLYGEAIAVRDEEKGNDVANSYTQPFHLPDKARQPLYRLARQLLQWLKAPSSTYLMQFGIDDRGIYFDRLWPFPAPPALGSLGIQDPDLYTCHWYCLAGLPILDLTIAPSLRP